VLASRFPNVHLWGSWWYAALPTVTAQSSAIRLEMLGTQVQAATQPHHP
jgi:hypothetical protein